MYKVYCTDGETKEIWDYYIIEHESDPDYGERTHPGDLVWRLGSGLRNELTEGTKVYVLRRVGDMCLYSVLPEEAEAITGLHMPAAMDRLRELVHESGGG